MKEKLKNLLDLLKSKFKKEEPQEVQEKEKKKIYNSKDLWQ